MNFNPSIIEMPFASGVIISSECKIFSMPKIMKKSYAKLANLNLSCCEAHVYACYHDVDFKELCTQSKFKMFLEMFSKIWKFDCGISINRDIERTDEMKFVQYDHDKVASCIHYGPYQKVGESYKRLYNWLIDSGHQAKNTSFEIYLNNPNEVSAKELETRLLIPII